MKPYTKKEVVYYIDSDKKEEIRQLRADLYDTYKNVSEYPNGLHETRIICDNLNSWFSGRYMGLKRQCRTI